MIPRMHHVGVEAADGLFAAGGDAIVQDAGGAVLAGERGEGCCSCCRRRLVRRIGRDMRGMYMSHFIF